MSTIKVTANKLGVVSKPLLIHVNKVIFQSAFKQQQIVYYRIPFTYNYQSIEKLTNQDLYLPNGNLSYKIINYVKKTQELIQNQTTINIKNDQITLVNSTKQGSIQIQGTIINQAKQSDVFADLSLKDIQGYEKYYQYRKKFKTLENITRKIVFSIDHRLKIICQKGQSKQEFFFSLDELKTKQIKNWYIELNSHTKLSFMFQQIISIGDSNFEKTIQEGQIQLGQIQWSNSYDIVLQMSQYLKITLSMKIVKNKNLSKFEFVSLRVFETSEIGKTLTIGNQQTINSASSAIQIRPLLDNKYYDLQYGYLSKNLGEITKMGQQQKIHKYLQKLTPSKEKYQHFINQKVMDLSNSKNLIFKINGQLIQIPLIYVLQGYNCFMNQNCFVKFMVELIDDRNQNKNNTQNITTYEKFKAIPKKLYQVQIKDMLNIGQIIDIIQKSIVSNEKSFYFKIICESNIYTVEFQISTIKEKDFKTQAKQLEMKTEYSHFLDGKFLLLKQSDNKEIFLMIKSLNLQPFYLLQMTDTSLISFDISTSKHVIMHGQMQKSQAYCSGNEFLKKIILSPNGNYDSQQKSVISLSFKQINQQIDGSSFNFKLKYSIFASKWKSSSSVYYDLEIQRIREEQPNKKKKRMDKDRMKEKAQLQIKDEQISNNRIKQFSTNKSCFVQKSSNLKLQIKVRKMHYNVDLDTFDDSMLIVRTLLLNRNIQDKINEGTISSQLAPHYFRQYEFDAYDQHINQKVTLKLEIYCSKEPFSGGDQHVYKLKIPHFLWKMNNLMKEGQSEPKMQVETFLSSKSKKNESKQLIYNSAQQVSLPHFNQSDGISIKITYENGFSDIGYGKIRQCIKAKCQIVKDVIAWLDDAEWYFASVNLSKSSFYFLIKMQFDPNAERLSSNQSRATQKTKSKQKKQTSNQKGGPDIFAKTLRNQDIVTKLKQNKNNLNQQLRQLTSKYVQRQQMVTYLKKKITETEQQNRRKKQQMEAALQSNKTKTKPKTKLKNDQTAKPSIYRNICECGQRNPPFMGYCSKCLEKLRQKYEIFFKQYQQKASQYEMTMFKKFSLRDKIQTLKQKIHSYKDSMKIPDQLQTGIQSSNQFQNTYERMQQKQLTLQLQQLKLQIFDLERQRQSQFDRRAYQMNQLQRKIKKEEDQLWGKSQQLNTLHLKLKQVQLQIKRNQQEKKENSY